jgi:hypothetical protein
MRVGIEITAPVRLGANIIPCHQSRGRQLSQPIVS